VISVGIGTALITVAATCCSVADTVNVTVAQTPDHITISPSSVNLVPGQSRTLVGTLRDRAGGEIRGASFTWTSKNKAVATVNGLGTVTGVAVGSTQIQATSNGITKSVPVTVSLNAVGGPWFEFDPTDYATLQAIWDDPNLSNRSNTNSKQLLTGLTTPWGGTKAVKVIMDAGEGAGGVRVIYPDADTDKPRELWAEWYILYSDNWKTDWGGENNPDQKTWLFYDQRDAGPTRWSYKIGVFGTGIQSYTVWDSKYPPCSGYPKPLTDTVWNQQWHRLRIHMKMNNEAANSYATLHAWLDDTQILDVNPGDVGDPYEPVRNSNQLNTDYFRTTLLGDIVNQTPKETVYYYVGRHRAWISDPGWN
jgi:hypothetical protein